MNEKSVIGWIKKAESDLILGKAGMVNNDPPTDGICFHMQQCVEKYLKAFLIFNGKEIEKTHDITKLIDSCSKVDKDFLLLYEIEADKLTDYAVESRYDILFFPSVDETKLLIVTAEKVKTFVLKKLQENGFKGE